MFAFATIPCHLPCPATFSVTSCVGAFHLAPISTTELVSLRQHTVGMVPMRALILVLTWYPCSVPGLSLEAVAVTQVRSDLREPGVRRPDRASWEGMMEPQVDKIDAARGPHRPARSPKCRSAPTKNLALCYKIGCVRNKSNEDSCDQSKTGASEMGVALEVLEGPLSGRNQANQMARTTS